MFALEEYLRNNHIQRQCAVAAPKLNYQPAMFRQFEHVASDFQRQLKKRCEMLACGNFHRAIRQELTECEARPWSDHKIIRSFERKNKYLPRNQPNDNHVVVLHEACLCTEFPLHKMCANKCK